ncbi:hypothetical protein D6D02_06686 [Aureobasidium pullulans]|nr:hypothetical protein D6D02_06686 [Aureobasidium pullulans]
MPYIIQAGDLEPHPPRLPSSILRLPKTHPVRRFEEHKGLVPPKEACRSRPDRRLPPAPLPLEHPPAVCARQLSPPPLSPSAPPPPGPPAQPSAVSSALGPLPPSLDIPELRPAPLVIIPSGRAVKRVVKVTAEPSDTAWKRVFGDKPRRVLAAIPETRNNIPMARPTPTGNDLCLVPAGSENAVPTTRGIIEEYQEEKDYEKTGNDDERTPVYLSPKPAGSAVKTARVSNANNPTDDSSVPRVPPKAKQLLGSPTHNSDWYFGRNGQSPHHSQSHPPGNSVNSLRHSASSKVVNFLTPTKNKKSSTCSTHPHADMVKNPAPAGMRPNQVQGPSPLKQSFGHSPISARNMPAQFSPEKQAVAGASPIRNPRKSDVSTGMSNAFSPHKSIASPKKSIVSPKGDFSIKRALSNALTPKHKRDKGPPVPEKDTPPDSRLSANITDFNCRPSDAYSGNAFAAAIDDDNEEPRNESPQSSETILVCMSDECSPIKVVPSGVARLHHKPHSIFKGEAGIMEVEPELFRQIEEEFQTPPIPTNLIYSPATDRGTWESNKSSTEEDDAPDYSMEGLLPGGLLPATTYQPPEIEEKRKAKPCIYSPSIYSNNDVFRNDSFNNADKEYKVTTPVPPNSLENSPAFKAQEMRQLGYGMGYADKMLPGPRIQQPIKYIKTVEPNDYVYKPEDHKFKRDGAETPVFTHDFAVDNAQKHQSAIRNSVYAAKVTPDKVYNFANGTYEHPSAVPPPLRRTSGESSSPSLRERYMEKDQGGLGINLSEVGSFKDNDTTMGVDGDADDERSRESEFLKTPLSNAFNSLWTPRVKAERERKDFGKSLRSMNQRISDLHTENVERLADMTKKMDRAIKSDGKFQIQLDNIRESVDAIGIAFVQFGMDDEKVQLIADKVIDALYPIITKGHEQNKADTERILARVDKCHDEMAREFDSLKKKSRKLHDRLASLDEHIWSTAHPNEEPREYAGMAGDYTDYHDDTC